MVWHCPIEQGGNAPASPCDRPQAHLTGKPKWHCPGIDRNADIWAVVSVNALFGASVAAYAEKAVSGCMTRNRVGNFDVKNKLINIYFLITCGLCFSPPLALNGPGQGSTPRSFCRTKYSLSSHIIINNVRHCQMIAARCQKSTPIDISHFLSLRADCSYRSNASSQGVVFQVDFDLVVPATGFRITPINPLALVPTALSKNLSGPLSISEIQGEPKSG